MADNYRPPDMDDFYHDNAEIKKRHALFEFCTQIDFSWSPDQDAQRDRIIKSKAHDVLSDMMLRIERATVILRADGHIFFAPNEEMNRITDAKIGSKPS